MYNQEIVDKALNKLNDFTSFIKVENETGYSKVQSFKDVFFSLPDDMGTRGTKIMMISDSKDSYLTHFLKIPSNGAVKHHFHENLNEYVTVVKGCVNYKVYKNDKYSEIIKEGKLKRSETLSIDAGQTHYIFTSEKCTYMVVDFKEK